MICSADNDTISIAEMPSEARSLFIGKVASRSHEMTRHCVFSWLGVVRRVTLIRDGTEIIGVRQSIGMPGFMSGSTTDGECPALQRGVRTAQNAAAAGSGIRFIAAGKDP